MSDGVTLNPSGIDYIYFCTVNPSTGDPSTPIQINEGFTTCSSPLIASGINFSQTRYALVVWFDPSLGVLWGKARHANGTWGGERQLLDGVSSDISLAPISVAFSEDTVWNLFWRQPGSIRYAKIKITLAPDTVSTEVVALSTPKYGRRALPRAQRFTTGIELRQ